LKESMYVGLLNKENRCWFPVFATRRDNYTAAVVFVAHRNKFMQNFLTYLH
jgi:hypothetical protein